MMLYVLAALAVWRVTHMLLRETGPWGLIRRLRIALGVIYDREDETTLVGFRYELTVCMWCLSVWTGTIAVAIMWLVEPVWVRYVLFTPFAISAVCVMIDKHFGMVGR